MKKAPDYVMKKRGFKTQRQWRQVKRRELDELIKSFGKYRVGCFFCPGSDGEVGVISNALDKMKKSHSQKEWGK